MRGLNCSIVSPRHCPGGLKRGTFHSWLHCWVANCLTFPTFLGVFAMSALDKRPIDRACAKREELERELRKCPDFQLYLMTESQKDRARMERLLLEVPNFRLWHVLTHSIKWARTCVSEKSSDALSNVTDGEPRQVGTKSEYPPAITNTGYPKALRDPSRGFCRC
jgi:hypothetical protein